MAAYLIAEIEVRDPVAYEEYRRQVTAVIEQYGGRYLARGGRVEVLEGPARPGRLVLLEFPDMAALRRFYDSPEYRPLKTLRERAATSALVAAEGI